MLFPSFQGPLIEAREHNKEAAAGIDKPNLLKAILDEGLHVRVVSQSPDAASRNQQLQASALTGAALVAQQKPDHFSNTPGSHPLPPFVPLAKISRHSGA
jgi:hypothetical protein